MKRALDARGMSVEQGRVVARDRDEWRAVISAYVKVRPHRQHAVGNKL